MSYEAKVLADSMSPDGVRLSTIQVTLPRIVLAEFNTHRALSRNSASSRAIPVEKRITMIEEDPFVPEQFGRNQKGMQATQTLEHKEAVDARFVWLSAKEKAVGYARDLAKLGVHKQLANRLLEPFAWHTIICTATEWANFFALRCHPDAQPEIRKAAEMMREAMLLSTPKTVPYGAWHLPLINEDDIEEMKATVGAALFQSPEVALPRLDAAMEKWCKVSIARCARVSYLTHDGRRDQEEDLKLYERLVTSGHLSPLEHVARPMEGTDLEGRVAEEGAENTFCGNFRGWLQHRKLVPGEDNILGRRGET